MKKRLIPIFLLVTFILTLTANAASPRSINIVKGIFFSGTTATCSLNIISESDNISATLELWSGSTLLKSWAGSGKGSLSMRQTYSATKGVTYTIKVTGTINGKAISTGSTSGTC